MIKVCLNLLSKYSSKNNLLVVITLLVTSNILVFLTYIFIPILALSLLNDGKIIGATSLENLHLIKINFSFFEVAYLTVFFAFLGNFFSILYLKTSNNLCSLVGARIQLQYFKFFLNKNYEYFLKKENSIFSNDIVIDIVRLINGVFVPFFSLLNALFLGIILIIGIIYINPVISLGILIFLTLIYFSIFSWFKKKVYATSDVISENQKSILELTSFSFSLNKDVKLYNLFNYLNKKISENILSTSKIRSYVNFITLSPKYIIEGILVTLIIVSLIVIYKHNLNSLNLLINFSFILILMLKILPTVQQIYVNMNTINSNKSLLKKFKIIPNTTKENINKKKIIFNKIIEIKNLHFGYIKDLKIFSNLNLKIKKGSKIMVIGSNGSGKSTLANILMGLIKPTKGKILIDNKEYPHEKLATIYSSLETSPYFVNASLEENIAYKKELNHEEKIRVKKIIYKSELQSKAALFKRKKLNKNIALKLSQGEKQKIAFARHLFFEKEFLIIDEGTSNLSINLENNFFKMLKKEYPNLTILYISHRMKNHSSFNEVYAIKNKKLAKFTKSKNFNSKKS
jgi:ABC-type multidrug transport system fused ATPase/permease subunit